MAWNETTQEQYESLSDRFETDLTDEEWESIEPLLAHPHRRDVHAAPI